MGKRTMNLGNLWRRMMEEWRMKYRLRKVFVTYLLALFIGVTVVATLGVGVGCVWAGMRTLADGLSHNLETNSWQYRLTLKCLEQAKINHKWVKLFTDYDVVVILQNNLELRPSGGFMGSYARVVTDEKGIRDIKIQDIYVPDGQSVGHGEPPYPIQEAFGQGWWKLRDANWDVDFASAAATTKWFLEQGGEPRIDGLVAVNQSTVAKLLDVVGPISLVTYDETVTAGNLTQSAQRHAQVEKDKRGFLGAVGVVMTEKMKAAGMWKWVQIAKVIYEEVEKGEVMLWFEDDDLQTDVEGWGWAGKLDEGWAGLGDYIYIIESNLGANKANCCIKRMVRQEVEKGEGKIKIEWENNNPYSQPMPPESWGGDYRNYVRVAMPASHQVQAIEFGGRQLRRATAEDFGGPNALSQGLREEIYVVEERGNLQTIGFWAVVPAGQSAAAWVETAGGGRGGKLLVKHQPGMGVLPYKLTVDGKVVADEE